MRTLEEMVTSLRARDTDPAYAGTPVLDAYARISRNPEDGTMEKTDRQLGDVLKEISSRRARLGLILRDDNISAWKKGSVRAAWNELIARLESGLSNGVCVWHTDRLMRRMDDLEKLINLADTRGVEVASCQGAYQLASADDRFTLRVLTAAAQKESDSTSRRQRRKIRAAREAGISAYGGPRPFGFPGKGADADRVTAERAAIRDAARAHLAGISLCEIVRDWNERGLLTTRGKPFIVASLKQVLLRPRNAGLVKHQGQILGTATDGDPIFDRATLSQLQAVFASRGKGRPASLDYMLSGILKCGKCASTMVGGIHTGRVYKSGPRTGETVRVYRCQTTETRTGSCGSVSIDWQTVEEYVTAEAFGALRDPELAEMAVKRSADLDRIETDLAKIRQRRLDLAARNAAGDLDDDEYDTHRAVLTERVKALADERDALIALGAGQSGTTVPVTVIEAAWPKLSTDERRAILRRAFPYGVSVITGGGRWGLSAAERITAIERPA